jgi:hypothetical protein
VQILKATGMDWREKDTCGCGPVVWQITDDESRSLDHKCSR